ncbi:hypothetical protein G6M89_03650 [Natronolimnobius sp. AArcel1]|uniref:hypothetical protein n=1 Tax=Natronolimnobius sp. AArcel1 TaxID=1679093 RepID=UPI0013EBFFF5|nr:hypothetical protein [Natronolimnobius sp. AArcel1]NGM68115.1 hypothetical protein [Natronolimnobius sp. AArcel1]
MKRRAILAALVSTVGATAGCVDGSGPNSANGSGTGNDSTADTVAGHFDSGPDRPACDVDSATVEVQRGDETRDAETAATRPYPDPPTAVAEDDLLEYVESFDHAFVTQSILCDQSQSEEILQIGYSLETYERIDRDDDIEMIVLLRAAGATSGVGEDGYEWQTDLGLSGVVYAVDDTGLARAEFREDGAADADELDANAPDPLEDGTLVAAFE